MARFSSALPTLDAGQVLPTHTVTSEQGVAEVDPVEVDHQAELSFVPVVATAEADDVHRGSEDESEAPPTSFLDTINSVYQFLPEEQCPKMELPPPKVKSLFEMATVQEPLRECPSFPSHRQSACWLS